MFFFKLNRLEEEDKGKKNTLCIFVDSEDDVGKIQTVNSQEPLLSRLCFSFFPESWVFFGNVTPSFSSSSRVTCEECVRRSEEDGDGDGEEGGREGGARK